jgi:hypothetical protein
MQESNLVTKGGLLVVPLPEFFICKKLIFKRVIQHFFHLLGLQSCQIDQL